MGFLFAYTTLTCQTEEMQCWLSESLLSGPQRKKITFKISYLGATEHFTFAPFSGIMVAVEFRV
jgi:hypothetical protein